MRTARSVFGGVVPLLSVRWSKVQTHAPFIALYYYYCYLVVVAFKIAFTNSVY